MEMEIGAIYTLWLREMIRFTRAKSRIIGNISMPFLWLALLGTGLSASFSLPNSHFSYLSFLAPGIIGMSLLFASLFSGVSVIWDRQFGFLKEILVTPVSRTSIVLGKLAGSTTISLINGMLVFIIAVALGAIPASELSPGALVVPLVFMVLISASFVSIGLVIAAVVNNMEGFQLLMNLLVMPMFFLSGAIFPFDNVPDWLKTISFLDPLMYGVDGMRGVMMGVSRFPVAVDFAVLGAFCAVMVVVSSYAFSRMKAT